MPLRLERLAGRGLDEAQARARMAAQASDEQRRAIADEVVLNGGDRAELAVAVHALWDRLQEYHESGADRFAASSLCRTRFAGSEQRPGLGWHPRIG